MINKINNTGKTFDGVVVSDKMTNTIVVSLEYTKSHPLYKKIYRKHKNIYAENNLSAKIGEIVKGGVSAGANQIGSVSFTIENKEEIEKEAREMAIKNAKEKAKEMEKELGIKLGRLTSFSEYNDNGVYARTLGAGEMQKVMLDSVATPEIATGENRITSNVSLVYEIK